MKRGLPEFVRRRLDPAQRYGLRTTLFAIAIVLVAVPFGLLLDSVIRNGPLVRYDGAAARILHEWFREHRAWLAALRVLSEIGRPPSLVLVTTIAGIYLFARKRYRLLAFLVVTGLVGSFVDSMVKILVDRDRPSLTEPFATFHGQSFPSGHSMSSVYVFGALLLVFFPVIAPRLRTWAVAGTALLIAGIGFSRLALGAHYITDVIGGYALGLAWLAASTAAFSIWREERGRKPVDPMRGLEPEAKRDLAVGS